MKIQYYFLLRSLPSGKGYIYLRATKKQISKYIAINLEVDPKNWDNKKRRVKARDRDYVFKNNYIDVIEKNAKDIIIGALLDHKDLSINEFAVMIRNNDSSNIDFFEFANKITEEKKHLLGKATLKNYGYQIEKIRSFNKSFAITEVNVDFVKKYDLHLINHFKNGENTRIKSLTYLRMLCNEAIKGDILKKNPFDIFKLKSMTSREEYLTLNELEALEKLYISKKLEPGERVTLKAFLFGCYTGISYSDLTTITFENISTVKIEDKEFKLIRYNRTKTGNQYRVPLISKAINLLDNEEEKNQKIFTTYANQVFNINLKKIQTKADIKKNLIFHLSRHTFGTHATTMGIPQNIVMEMMGHKDMKVNSIYSKIQDEALINAMKGMTDIKSVS